MATWDEDFFRGGTRGLVFGLVGGSLMGVLYALDVGIDAALPWQALLVHAYTTACLSGAVPMAVIEGSRGWSLAGLARVLALVVTGSLAGLFGVTHIATLPDTPYPGPVLATMTLLIASIGFSTYAQPSSLKPQARVAVALVPFALCIPLIFAANGLVRESGILGLERLTVLAYELGLEGIGIVGGALAGLCVGAYVEITILLAKLFRSLVKRSELAADREDVAEGA